MARVSSYDNTYHLKQVGVTRQGMMAIKAICLENNIPLDSDLFAITDILEKSHTARIRERWRIDTTLEVIDTINELKRIYGNNL